MTPERRQAAGALVRFTSDEGLLAYRSPLLDALGIPHLFTTRSGGDGDVHPGPGAWGHAFEERVARAAGLPGARIVRVRQVHGAEVVALGDTEPDPSWEADALVSERTDRLVCVHVADCVPVLLARLDGRRVAAVHAGWRGLVAGVLPRALAHFAGEPPVAAIGPCLSRAHFEVGPEVVAAFENAGLGAVVEQRAGARARIDLRAAARLQLEAAGVRDVDASEACTYAEPEEYFSYRRDVTHGGEPRTGRLAALIAARAIAPARPGRG